MFSRTKHQEAGVGDLVKSGLLKPGKVGGIVETSMNHTILGAAFAVSLLAGPTAGVTTTGYTGDTGRCDGGWGNFRAATPQAWRDA